MKLSEMRQLLTTRDIQLTKSLGQNFLHDGNQLRRIAAQAELKSSDRILEVGPGLGPLTAELLAGAGHVMAIEKDVRLVAFLRERFASLLAGEAPRLEVLHADALDYLRDTDRDWSGWKLVSNLPYSVASPILVELAQVAHGPELLVATLQIEVARRLAAGPGDGDYGLLTLLVQLDYAPEGWFKIPASCFFPEPEVDSACITLRRRPQRLLVPGLRPVFEKVIRRAFSQRRKVMLKLLKQDWPAPRLEAACQALGLDPKARAETLSLEQFVALALDLARSD